MKTGMRFALISLLICIILPGCKPSQARLDATSTQAAANIFATLTAQAPAATPTYPPLPTATKMPTAPPTLTPIPTLPPTEAPTLTLASTPTHTPTLVPAKVLPHGDLPHNETLYIAGQYGGDPANFNPFSNSPAWPAGMGSPVLVYESLFVYNQLTGAIDPLLARQYEFAADNSKVTVTLQDGTRWSDGSPLTTEDVIYTYKLAKTHKEISYSNLFKTITGIKATGDRALEITLNPKQINPDLVKNYLATIMILPKAVFYPLEARGRLSQAVITDPLGSGPYKLFDYSRQRVALVRDDTYWGKAVFGLPAPRYVVSQILTNDAGAQAIQNGEMDLSQQFIPQVWRMSEAPSSAPVGTWFKDQPYYLPGSIPMLIINVHRRGLDNRLVRRALAYSINYPMIAEIAMSKYSIPAFSSLILPEGGEKALFNVAQVQASGWSYDPAKARDILENQLKAKKGPDGVYVLPNGARLGPWTARTVNGWTDWQTAIKIVVDSARAAGFDIKADYPDYAVVNTRLQNGNFDLTLWYISGIGSASPWLRFRDMMDIRGVPGMGQPAFWDYGRFSHPQVASLLDKAGQASDPAAVKEVYDQLDRLFMDNVPGIPLMYRPFEFYTFNQTYWSGFPTSEDPTAPPMLSGAGIQWLYKIKPVNQ
jgi:peptide/nickel transport system substrate-binding protein